MTWRIKKACMELNDIFLAYETSPATAEKMYARFEKKYTEEEIEIICEKMFLDSNQLDAIAKLGDSQ